MKAWKIILIILIVLVAIGFAIMGTMTSLYGPEGPTEDVSIYNGTGIDSFDYEIGYVYEGKEVSDNFTITVETEGNWTADYNNGEISIWNDDNKTIKHISITKDGKEYGINAHATEEEVDNTIGLFEIRYANDYAQISLYS